MDRLWQDMDERVPTPGPERTWPPYLYGALLAALAVAARLALDPLLGDRVALIIFVPAIVLAAATGGMAPGLATTALAMAAGAWFLVRYGTNLANGIDLAFLGALGIALSIGGWLGRASRESVVSLNRHILGRQAHLQSILETVPDAMIVIDEKGAIQSYSPVAERMFQWPRDEVMGQNVNMLMPSPDHEAHDSYLRRYLDTSERRIIGLPRKVTARRKDGSDFPAELFVGEALSGDHRFFTGFLQDLTERQTAETRLQALQSELVHIARLSDMGEMASGLAHELNQPLSAISSYLRASQRLLTTQNPESPAIPIISNAADQALRAGDIIRRLRNFVARGESERDEESLRALIEDAAALGLSGARERGVISRFKWSEAVDSVVVDKVQVQQVALNLVRNALEAMEDSGRQELRISTEPGEDGMAMISVADTGPGIDPAIADRLFQPFVTTKGAAGMGVGLSICRTIIEAHGGRIWAEPNPDGGSIFRFTVPVAGPEDSGDE
ncbi:MAG: PAS domain-containing sensor histidine kinase [Caulobacteraceae bacterium]